MQVSAAKIMGRLGGVEEYLPTICGGKGEAVVGGGNQGVDPRRTFTLANPTPGLECPLQAVLGNAREIYKPQNL